VWVLVYGPIAGLVAGYSGYAILRRRRIDPQLPSVFGGACLIMGAGAFGAEWVGLHMRSKVWYGLTLVVEEFGEMLGVSLLLYGLLRYRRALGQRGGRPCLHPRGWLGSTIAQRTDSRLPREGCRDAR
jgi:hypothetical protein